MNATTPPPSNSRRQVEYDIRAPEKGMREAVEAFVGDMPDRPNHLDVVISKERGHRRSVRIFPDRATVRWNGTLLQFFGGDCAALGDNQEIGPLRRCSGRINTQSTHWEAGKLSILFPGPEEIL